MTKYATRQRKALLQYLHSHADEQLTARQIGEALSGEEISASAVYRNLAALEEAGQVRRLSKSGAREIFFQYAGAEHCRDCLHLSCKKCGKTIHMDADEAERLIQSVAICDKFKIDKTDTVLYGVCGECLQGKEAQK